MQLPSGIPKYKSARSRATAGSKPNARHLCAEAAYATHGQCGGFGCRLRLHREAPPRRYDGCHPDAARCSPLIMLANESPRAFPAHKCRLPWRPRSSLPLPKISKRVVVWRRYSNNYSNKYSSPRRSLDARTYPKFAREIIPGACLAKSSSSLAKFDQTWPNCGRVRQPMRDTSSNMRWRAR